MTRLYRVAVSVGWRGVRRRRVGGIAANLGFGPVNRVGVLAKTQIRGESAEAQTELSAARGLSSPPACPLCTESSVECRRVAVAARLDAESI